MNPSRHEIVRNLFERAMELLPAERQAFVAEQSGRDEALRDEVLDLLQFAADDGRPTNLDDLQYHPMDVESFVAHLPETLGDYSLLSVLGHGGMGVVCRARHEPTQRDVALKILLPRAAPRQMLARFHREVAALKSLQHPGVARVLDSGAFQFSDRPCPFFAMDYVDGTPLPQMLQQTPHALFDRVRLLAEVCDIAAYAHGRGVVHRDIKPDNILVRPDGSPVLLDFGLAQVDHLAAASSTSMATHVGQLIGTVRYMSPEQARGATTEVGPASDIYSLGVLGFELLTGQLPYDLPAQNVPASIVAINTIPAVRAGSLVPQLRGDLELVLDQALQKDPAQRIESAGQFAERLRAAAGTLLRPGAARAVRMRHALRGRNRLAAALVTLLVASLGIAWLRQATSIHGHIEGAGAGPVTLRLEDPATGNALRTIVISPPYRFALRGVTSGRELALCARTSSSVAAVRLEPLHRSRRIDVHLELQALPDGVATDSLIAWWPADNSLRDIAGAHNGEPDGKVDFEPGVHGEAFVIRDADANAILITDSRVFSSRSAFSIETWFRPLFPRASSENELDTFFNLQTGCDRRGTTFTLEAYTAENDHWPCFGMPDSTGSEIVASAHRQWPKDDPGYHHIAGTFDGQTMRLYFDGLEIASRHNPRPATSAQGRAKIGRHGDCLVRSAMALDDLRFFSRALEAREIAAIHASGLKTATPRL